MSFDRVEAQSLVGKQFESRVALLGMPIGTQGRVLRVQRRHEEYLVVLRWRSPNSLIPLEGWFGKEQLLRDFSEVPSH